MSPKSLDPNIIASKEQIRKNIRNSLINKKSSSPIKIDTTTPLFTKNDDIIRQFVSNFRNAGGIFIPCTKENFSERLVYLLNGKKYNFILNSNKSLNKILESARISYSDFIETDKPVDAAIIYSDLLIARSGSIGFSQKYSLYPSVLNLGKDIIVIAFIDHVVEDIGSAFQEIEKNIEQKTGVFTELITPTKVREDQEYSPENPQIILFFIQNS
ncbi:MAG: hypothetical protein CVU04_00140 [Bacteroidetes bacterium HGW-Bacteroidetes-20]|nr:MAG: hypothetical protein CVU04_00140 [Bacteroidetes bacterium HGW-Bacteroidetes-20]